MLKNISYILCFLFFFDFAFADTTLICKVKGTEEKTKKIKIDEEITVVIVEKPRFSITIQGSILTSDQLAEDTATKNYSKEDIWSIENEIFNKKSYITKWIEINRNTGYFKYSYMYAERHWVKTFTGSCVKAEGRKF